MAILYITPFTGLAETNNGAAPVAGKYYTSESIEVSVDDTATALPFSNADGYTLYASANMKIGLGGSGLAAADCKMFIPTGIFVYIPNQSTHIIKDDE